MDTIAFEIPAEDMAALEAMDAWNAINPPGQRVKVQCVGYKPFMGIQSGKAFLHWGRAYLKLEGGSVVLLSHVSSIPTA